MLYSILVAIDVLLALGIIGLILIQHGKGADVGAAFGSGASGTVFGSQGSASFLTRVTAILATLFFINSLALAYLAGNRPVAESVIDNVEQTIENNSGADTPVTESISDTVSSDIHSADESSEKSLMEDVTSEDMDEIDVPDIPGEVDAQTDAAANGSLNEVQDSMESIKENIKSTLDDVSPDDVPE